LRTLVNINVDEYIHHMINPIEMLRTHVGTRSKREVAREMGISATLLCDTLNGKRTPGRKILNYLGLKRTQEVSYEVNGAPKNKRRRS